MFTKRTIAIVFILLTCVTIWWQTTNWYENYLYENYHVSVSEKFKEKVDKLEDIMSRHGLLVSSLASIVESEVHEDVRLETVNRTHVKQVMKAMLELNSGLKSLQVTNRYGLNITVPSNGVSYIVGRDSSPKTNQLVVSDPFDLQLGGKGVALTKSIYREGEYWGSASIIVNLTSSVLASKLIDSNPELQMAFRTDKGKDFIGDPELFDHSLLRFTVNLPSRHWEVAAATIIKNSEVENKADLFRVFLAAFMFLLLGAMYIFYHQVFLVFTELRSNKAQPDQIFSFGSEPTNYFLRKRKSSFVMPFIATATITLSLAALHYFIKEQDRGADSKLLSTKLSHSVSKIETQLSLDENFLYLLATEIPQVGLQNEDIEKCLKDYLLPHSSLLHFSLSDSNFKLVKRVSSTQTQSSVALKLALTELEKAAQLSKKYGAVVYTKPFMLEQAQPVFALFVPIFSGEKFIGNLGAIYSIPKLVDTLVAENFSEQYQVSMQDNKHKLLYQSDTDFSSYHLAHNAPISKLHNLLWLSVATKPSTISEGMKLFVFLLSLFITGVAVSLWLQYKQNQLVWKKGRSLAESQNHFHSIAHSAPIAVLITQPQTGKILYGNLRANELLTSGDKSLSGRHAAEFYVNPKDRNLFVEYLTLQNRVDGFEVQIKSDAGDLIWASLSSKVVEYTDGEAVITSITDLTQQRTYQDQLYRKANFDELTGLPNRGMTFERLTSAINIAKLNNTSVVLMLLDLDDFKKVNDSFGHNAGDALLKQISSRIGHLINPNDTLGRLGGDEFVIILTEPHSVANAQLIAEEVNKSCSQPVLIQHHEVVVGCSIGIATFPQDGNDYEALTKNADAAMYESKMAGRNALKFYSNAMSNAVQSRLEMENELRQALRRDELYVLYQPIISGDTGIVIGVEALLRWNNPKLGHVSPADFIPLAESLGLISTIGEWVLEQSCAQIKKWRKHEHGPRYVSVNVSSRQLLNNVIVDDVHLGLALHGLPASALELELTESALIENSEENQKTFNKLHKLGVHLAVDDFGIGYSSLSYLRRFSFDTLKIDRSFIKDVPHQKDAIQLVDAILSMANSLGMKIVAEGVETKEQLDFLQQMGCSAIQGFYISRPLAVDDVLPFCEKQNLASAPPTITQGEESIEL
ncbi:EAL domain-containing protein [Parashewanella curva]|uniref:cyclic-guanylate-specific phosphodiesterase n=1 Tax=Parashewanella curva TaxID=2338552 RepID=A0A3L8PWI2_9GAMM|nr:EAL domain-containing protein [Parashewanella curva]RLV59724.1 EAL domain-containing protein [Parashewanella curva]